MSGPRSHRLRALAAVLATSLTACAVATTPPAKKASTSPPTQKVAAVKPSADPETREPSPSPVPTPTSPLALAAPSLAPAPITSNGDADRSQPLPVQPTPGFLEAPLPTGATVLSNNGSNLTLLESPKISPNSDHPANFPDSCDKRFGMFDGVKLAGFAELAKELNILANEAGFKAIDEDGDGSLQLAEICKVETLIAAERAKQQPAGRVGDDKGDGGDLPGVNGGFEGAVR